MDTKELLKKVRKIEIKTRRLSDAVFGGEYHSTFKGRGMTFSEVRQYQFGDDVRNIDWNVTARYNEPFVKTFEEERELTLMLMADVSGSTYFGSGDAEKREIITEVSATLAFSALQNNDKVGLILFSDQIELFVPPKKGKTHVLRIIRELLEFKPQNKTTDVSAALAYLAGVQKKKAITFLMSDFMTADYEKSLKTIGKKHDLTGIRIYDPREEELPAMGLVPFVDQETGVRKWVNTSSRKARRDYHKNYVENVRYFQYVFKKADSGIIELQTDRDYFKQLLGYFKRR